MLCQGKYLIFVHCYKQCAFLSHVVTLCVLFFFTNYSITRYEYEKSPHCLFILMSKFPHFFPSFLRFVNVHQFDRYRHGHQQSSHFGKGFSFDSVFYLNSHLLLSPKTTRYGRQNDIEQTIAILR